MKNLNTDSTDYIKTVKTDSLSPDKGLGGLHISRVAFKERIFKHTNI